ncbi:addiction module toxin RelE [Yersinia enterocolitica]|nr:addiction module toxin RelE [Yersinia enterocolitica]
MASGFVHLSLLDETNLQKAIVYPINFKMQEGGKRKNPDELTSVSDSGERE